jgi:hypothetical protein
MYKKLSFKNLSFKKSNYRSGVTTDNAFEGIFGSLTCKVGGLWSAEHLPRIEHSSR